MSQQYNAIRHGLYAKEALLPHENRQEYLRFRRKIISELLPDGQLQIHLANQLADDAWRLRRLDKLILTMQGEIYRALTTEMICDVGIVDKSLWNEAPQFITDMQTKFSRDQIVQAQRYCKEYKQCEKNFKGIPNLQAVQSQFDFMFGIVNDYVISLSETELISSVTQKFSPIWQTNNETLWKRMRTLYVLMYFRANWKTIQKNALPWVEGWYLIQESSHRHLQAQKQLAVAARTQFSKQLKTYTDIKKSLIAFSGTLAQLVAGADVKDATSTLVHKDKASSQASMPITPVATCAPSAPSASPASTVPLASCAQASTLTAG